LFERILLIINVLVLTFLFIGFPLYIAGRAWNDAIVSRVGAYLLVIGIGLLAIRIIYWIAEEMVGKGLESMAKDKT
jgi:hypothetical protein